MARWIGIQFLGVVIWGAIFIIGRAIFGAFGYGIDMPVGDAFSVMVPTIFAVVTASAIWNIDQ